VTGISAVRWLRPRRATGPRYRRWRGWAAAAVRRGGWRLVLGASGGLRIHGRPPEQPCVLVANHSSHADTAALLAALRARRRPMVAAAADYWFSRADRALVCRTLVAGFPVRRGGGGSADLTTADRLLAGGHDVIIYPEGTRSRDGAIGDFRSGAARLAARTGAPLVPVAISGTGRLLPAHGRVRRTRVVVRIGAPVTEPAAARDAVAALLTTSIEP
jgi:1-acyl-sn-glycerol-3-phosphate acyltransferase